MNDMRRWDQPRKVKLTVRDFLRLNEAGAFNDYAKTELIRGEVIAMNSQFTRHARYKTNLLRALAEAVEVAMPGHEALVEVAVSIPPHSVPEPDITVTSYMGNGRDPVPVETVALIVEVADSTVKYDLGRKAKIYAQAMVPEYWVADVESGRFHQMWAPSTQGYREHAECALGEEIEAMTIASLRVTTRPA